MLLHPKEMIILKILVLNATTKERIGSVFFAREYFAQDLYKATCLITMPRRSIALLYHFLIAPFGAMIVKATSQIPKYKIFRSFYLTKDSEMTLTYNKLPNR